MIVKSKRSLSVQLLAFSSNLCFGSDLVSQLVSSSSWLLFIFNLVLEKLLHLHLFLSAAELVLFFPALELL
ncbi:hypothetical protein F511_26346 [Dorcoceras hygrometricum]|uniref:Uncharacterized protein n=1 Tax=Dorcoceras hygrometricum TaxID=472368 RepID=A0A2Z7D049_9LAMI|nr:hypothetical protein F511_26346 [Dorcoceras hygrometricum]